jgi:hypothetical protein
MCVKCEIYDYASTLRMYMLDGNKSIISSFVKISDLAHFDIHIWYSKFFEV